MSTKPFHINADLGEGYAIEEALMPYLDSCNIACGGHSGDRNTIKEVVALAQQYQVKIGAHPSYPDKENFGRKEMKLSDTELYHSLSDQIELLLDELSPTVLHHVKPHGALYHSCANDITSASIFLEVIKVLCPKAIVVTLPNSVLEKLAHTHGIAVWREAFIDRAYLSSGQLVPRSHPKGVLQEIQALYNQFYYLVQEQKVKTLDKTWIELKANTLCIHGDHPNSVENLKTMLHLFQKKHLPNE
jgi:UPF0271 protein